MRPLHFILALAICAPAVTYCAAMNSQAANARRVTATAYGNGTHCGAVIMSDHADSGTVAAALADASTMAKRDGCVTVWIDPDAPLHQHFTEEA